MLGIQLNIRTSRLDAIAGDRSPVATCFSQVLETWLRSGERTKSDLLPALRSESVNRMALARDIERDNGNYNYLVALVIQLSTRGTVNSDIWHLHFAEQPMNAKLPYMLPCMTVFSCIYNL